MLNSNLKKRIELYQARFANGREDEEGYDGTIQFEELHDVILRIDRKKHSVSRSKWKLGRVQRFLFYPATQSKKYRTSGTKCDA